jgi:glycosyltransferase involved in cell wall biosynthesis
VTPAENRSSTSPVNSVGVRADELPVTSVAVVVCAFTERRWDDLCAAVASLGHQTRPADEVVVVIDHNDELLARAVAGLPGARVIASRNPRGLSGARNTGVWASGSDVVLFLDDDAVPAGDWVEQMLRPFADPTVSGVAGRVDARWDAPGRPAWFPETFAWTIGCSYGSPAVVFYC